MTKRIGTATLILLASIVPTGLAQAPAPTMKQLMLDLIHPAANDLLLTVNRGGPSDDKEWAAMRRSALALAESGNSLATRVDSNDWRNAAKQLADAGLEAYKAAQARDAKALAAVTARIDASCTNCHKQFRPNVFPGEVRNELFAQEFPQVREHGYRSHRRRRRIRDPGRRGSCRSTRADDL